MLGASPVLSVGNMAKLQYDRHALTGFWPTIQLTMHFMPYRGF